MKNDTIAAISTGTVPAGIAIVRLSGKDGVKIADKIFKSKKPLCEAFSHTINFGHIVYNNEIIDEVLISVMKAPNTYTGEDVVEINCHGSILIQRKILGILIKSGARLAEPGEFTLRAFLNGRIDLSQAESVMDIISSENDTALKASISNLSGNFSAQISEIRQKILYEIAYIEAALDDPEHISLVEYPQRLEKIIDDIILKIQRLIDNGRNFNLIKEGISCAIVGGVNVGKSSLFNSLCGEEAAIVTDIPGTTRDMVSRKINIGEFSLNIIDTAGIRNSKDTVESLGIERSRAQIENANLILLVLDSSVPLSREDIELMELLEDKSAIILLNKSDLKSRFTKEEIQNISSKPVISISAKEMTGLTQIRDEVMKIFFRGKIKSEGEIFVVNDRHMECLENAKNSLFLVRDAIENEMPEDIFSVDLTDAYTYLGNILGEEIGEDIIEKVFSSFCVGK